MLSAPTSTAPAASIRAIRVASRDAGGRSRLIFEPARVARPSMSNRFFTAKGTPASGPTLWPAAIAASIAFALVRARPAVTSVNELNTVSRCSMRANAASVTSSADILRPLTALAISEAKGPPEASLMAASCGEDTGRLGVVGQREFIDHPRQPQRNLEVRPHRGPPGVFDRQREGLRDGIDIIVKRISGHCSPFYSTQAMIWTSGYRLPLQISCSKNKLPRRQIDAEVIAALMHRQRRMRDRRQQLLCIGILRVAQDFFGHALLHDAPAAHH